MPKLTFSHAINPLSLENPNRNWTTLPVAIGFKVGNEICLGPFSRGSTEIGLEILHPFTDEMLELPDEELYQFLVATNFQRGQLFHRNNGMRSILCHFTDETLELPDEELCRFLVVTNFTEGDCSTETMG